MVRKTTRNVKGEHKRGGTRKRPPTHTKKRSLGKRILTALKEVPLDKIRAVAFYRAKDDDLFTQWQSFFSEKGTPLTINQIAIPRKIDKTKTFVYLFAAGVFLNEALNESEFKDLNFIPMGIAGTALNNATNNYRIRKHRPNAIHDSFQQSIDDQQMELTQASNQFDNVKKKMARQLGVQYEDLRTMGADATLFRQNNFAATKLQVHHVVRYDGSIRDSVAEIIAAYMVYSDPTTIAAATAAAATAAAATAAATP
jgi:hypothetical protein